MPESVVIALIGFMGAILGAAIAGSTAIITAGIKDGKTHLPCAVLGLLASLGAAGGLVLGVVFGMFLVQPQFSSDTLAGVWTGTAKNGSVTMQVTFTVAKTCLLNSTCGSFNIPTLPCSGTFRIVGVSGSTFHFIAENKVGSCGAATEELLQLLPDGTLQYVSRGTYGETTGILRRQ